MNLSDVLEKADNGISFLRKEEVAILYKGYINLRNDLRILEEKLQHYRHKHTRKEQMKGYCGEYSDDHLWYCSSGYVVPSPEFDTSGASWAIGRCQCEDKR